MSKNFFKNLKCVGQSSLSSIDDLIVTPPPTPSSPPPPKPSCSKNPDIVITGPKPAMQRTPTKKATAQQHTNGAGASLPADVIPTTAPPATVTQQPAAPMQSAHNQIPVSQGFETYVHPNGRVNNTPTTVSGGAPANGAAAAAGVGASTGARPRNTPRDQGIEIIGVAVDDDEIPEEDLRVNEEIEKTVDESPEQKIRWRQLLAKTIVPRRKYQSDLKLVLKALRNSNDWKQVAALLEQMIKSFEDWETKRVIAMSERDGKILDSDELLARLQCEFVKIKNKAREFIQQQQYQQQMQESQAAANQNVVNMEYIAQEAAQRLRAETERVANIRAQEERAAAATNFAGAAGGISNPPPSTEAGTGVAPPFNNDRAQATTLQNDRDLNEQGRALSSMSLHTRESSPTSLSWDPTYGRQTFWDQTTNSNAQNVDPRLTNAAGQLPKRARVEQQQSSPINRGIMMPPEAVDPPPIQEICPPNCNSNRM